MTVSQAGLRLPVKLKLAGLEFLILLPVSVPKYWSLRTHHSWSAFIPIHLNTCSGLLCAVYRPVQWLHCSHRCGSLHPVIFLLIKAQATTTMGHTETTLLAAERRCLSPCHKWSLFVPTTLIRYRELEGKLGKTLRDLGHRAGSGEAPTSPASWLSSWPNDSERKEQTSRKWGRILSMDIDVLFKREAVAVEAGSNWQDKPGPSPDFWGWGWGSPICLVSAAPLHSESEPLWRLWDSALQGEVVSCFKS